MAGTTILDETRARWLANERRLLQELTLQLARLDPTREDVGTLQQVARERLVDAIGPYRRFVREEFDTLTALKTELDQTATTLRSLRAEIEATPGAPPSATRVG